MNLKEITSKLVEIENELAANRFYAAAQHVQNALNDLGTKTKINISGNKGSINIANDCSTINSTYEIQGSTNRKGSTTNFTKWEEF